MFGSDGNVKGDAGAEMMLSRIGAKAVSRGSIAFHYVTDKTVYESFRVGY